MAEKLTEIELDGIHLHETKPRTLGRDSSIVLTQVCLQSSAVLLPNLCYLLILFIYLVIYQWLSNIEKYKSYVIYTE